MEQSVGRRWMIGVSIEMARQRLQLGWSRIISSDREFVFVCIHYSVRSKHNWWTNWSQRICRNNSPMSARGGGVSAYSTVGSNNVACRRHVFRRPNDYQSNRQHATDKRLYSLHVAGRRLATLALMLGVFTECVWWRHRRWIDCVTLYILDWGSL